MKTIIDMANGDVSGLVLKDVTYLKTRRSSIAARPVALTKRNAFRSKLGIHALETAGTRPRRPARPMPVESISRCRYGFILVDGDSRAS